MKNKSVRFLTTAAVIAAIYATLTLLLPFGYMDIQFRAAEILTVLPFFTPAAVPGLAIGCFIANIPSPLGLWDMVFGTAATLIAAVLTRILPKKLAPIPPIICNAVIVGIELTCIFHKPLWYNILTVGFGEAVVCLVGGYLFIAVLDRIGKYIFKDGNSKRFTFGSKTPDNILNK